jgi:hypothetical protein
MLDEYKMVVMMLFSCSTGGWHGDFFHSSLDYLGKALEMLTSKSYKCIRRIQPMFHHIAGHGTLLVLFVDEMCRRKQEEAEQ